MVTDSCLEENTLIVRVISVQVLALIRMAVRHVLVDTAEDLEMKTQWSNRKLMIVGFSF